MPKALIITVGGSDEPVVISIKKHNPDFIYFICTAGKKETASTFCIDGEGNVCERVKEIKCKKCNEIIRKGEKYPSIIKQSDYRGEYNKIEIEDADDFYDIYEKTKEVIREAKEKGFEIIADFTAGTKTMSSVLAMLSALDFEIKPYLVKGKREDLVKTTEGSVPVNLESHFKRSRVDFLLKIYENLVKDFYYNSAITILDNILDMGLEPELEREIRKKREITMAFYLWDIFQYENAFNLLKNYNSMYKNEFEFLLRVKGNGKVNGYEPFFDLVCNAKRQANMGFYDNAVARLYRALELLAQIRLNKEYEIETNALEKSLDKVKNKEKWESKKKEKGEIKIGLQDDYELLEELGDPFGKVYQENKNAFIDKIKIRNNSKLAHGNDPVKEEDWKNFLKFFEEFTEKCLNSIRIKFEYIEFPDKI